MQKGTVRTAPMVATNSPSSSRLNATTKTTSTMTTKGSMRFQRFAMQ